jgi:hypothetical protein
MDRWLVTSSANTIVPTITVQAPRPFNRALNSQMTSAIKSTLSGVASATTARAQNPWPIAKLAVPAPANSTRPQAVPPSWPTSRIESVQRNTTVSASAATRALARFTRNASSPNGIGKRLTKWPSATESGWLEAPPLNAIVWASSCNVAALPAPTVGASVTK